MTDGRTIELKVRRKDADEETVAVPSVPFVLGRVGANLDLKDGAVSRRHCEIVEVPGGWAIRDLGSSNGTYVNDERIEESPVGDGDIIRIGQTEITFALLKESGAGIALGNGTQERKANLVDDTALWNLVELSMGAGSESQWLRAYLETLMKRHRADRGFVVEYDPGSGVARVIAANPGEGEELGSRGEGAFSRSIIDQVIQEKRGMVTSNAAVDPRFAEAQSIGEYDIRIVMCAPTRWQGDVNGAVCLERRQGGTPYTEEDVRQLQDLADLLGVAMMAWRGHLIERREEWERERLLRTFSPERVEQIIKQGGLSSVRRQVKDACVVAFAMFRLEDMIREKREEVWRLMSQLVAQSHDILKRHGGAMLGGTCAIFEAKGTRNEDYSIEGVRAGIEIQRISRAMIKRLARDQQVTFGIGVGIATGNALVGYFGAGQHVEYMGAGEIVLSASGLSCYAHDGEVLIDQNTYNKVRLFMNAHRVAPVSLPGVEQQVQVHRVASY